MPIMIPTPEEIAVMSWHEQRRVRRIVRQLLIALGTDHPCHHGSDRANASTLKARQEWARLVREEAKRIEKSTRATYEAIPDPDWQKHQAELIEALGGKG